MPKRSPNPRLVKTHRSYTYDEVAGDLGVHKNTVRRWVTHDGLPALTEQRPHLILGPELKWFLEKRRAKKRTPCPPGHVFCFRCRGPQTPAEGLVDYTPISQRHGTLSALCPSCETVMYRAVRKDDLPMFEQAAKARPASGRVED